MLNVDFYEGFLNVEDSETCFNYFSSMFGSSKRRQSIHYGIPGLNYKVEFRGDSFSKTVLDWTDNVYLQVIKQKLQELTKETYTVCVIQFYENGKIGIAKHKDREMIKGTTIAGLSLGSAREFRLHPPAFLKREVAVSTSLTSGSLYVLRPPTNDYWMHEIVKDSTTHPRISLTFRNYK